MTILSEASQLITLKPSSSSITESILEGNYQNASIITKVFETMESHLNLSNKTLIFGSHALNKATKKSMVSPWAILFSIFLFLKHWKRQPPTPQWQLRLDKESPFSCPKGWHQNCSTWFVGSGHGLIFLYLISSNLFLSLNFHRPIGQHAYKGFLASSGTLFESGPIRTQVCLRTEQPVKQTNNHLFKIFLHKA